MKKGWIITFIVVCIAFSVQRTVRSQQETREAVRVTSTPTPTNTPTPTYMPTNTPTPSPTSGVETVISMTSAAPPAQSQVQSQTAHSVASTTSPNSVVSTNANNNNNNNIVGNNGNNNNNSSNNANNTTVTSTPNTNSVTGGRVINNDASSMQSQFLSFVQNMIGSPSPTPTKKRVLTPTPQPTRFNVQPFRQPTPTNIPSLPTASPSMGTSVIPSPIPSPTNRPNNANSPIRKEEEKNGKIVKTVDNTKVFGLTIVPQVFATENNTSNKPLLPQEQTNEAPPSGGILVTLEQKNGGAFVTQQDELTVKRGDQSFTISNQSKPQSMPQSNSPSNTSPAVSPQLTINANNVIALSTMNLSVDPLSGILTVETPNGPQRVSIMPDEALGIVIELKALHAKEGIDPSILLISENGSLIYRISGEKVEKFLGLLPVPVQKQIVVSADTGSIIKVELSLFSKMVSFFTF